MPGKNYLSSHSSPARVTRLMPSLVVLGVLSGFLVLCWYAYRSGAPMKDGDLLVIEADKTPVKEKPLDAGGMQFPNQDKTIFNTFSAGSEQPPKVERVLPTPEEPVAPSAATAEGSGLIKEENKPSNPATPEQVIASADNPAQTQQDVLEAVKKPMVADAAKAPAAGDQTAIYAAPSTQNNAAGPSTDNQEKIASPSAGSSEPIVPESLPAKAVAPEKPVDKTNAATEQMDAIVGFQGKAGKDKASRSVTSKGGTARVQLGAYRSEKEAQDAWNAIQKKHRDLLANSSRDIVKADLGDKGIYYRLQVSGFDSVAGAKAVCSKLAASGQACLIPTAK